MKTLKISFFVLLFFTSGFSQFIKTDFLVSKDNQPSTLIQANPYLFLTDENAIFAIWDDYRKGDVKNFTQRFNITGEKSGKNFEVFGSEYLLSINDTFLTAKTETFDSPDNGLIMLSGKYSYKEQFITNDIWLGSASYNWCGTGRRKLSSEIIKFDNKIYSFFSDFEGLIKRYIYNSKGVREVFDTVAKKNIEILKVNGVTNGYAIFWVSSSRWEPEIPKYYLYGMFFNRNNELIADSVIITDLSKNVLNTDQFMNVQSVNDSLHQIIYLNEDMKRIQSFVVDDKGNTIKSQYIDLTDLFVGKIKTHNFYVTNFSNRERDLFVTFKYDNNTYKNVIYGFDAVGNYTGKKAENNVFSENLKNAVIKTGTNKYLFTYSDSNDVFLCRFENFTKSEIRKINDDTIGSNEENIHSFIKDSNTVMSVWRDEENFKGKQVSKYGDLLTTDKVLETSNFNFWSDNTPFAMMIKAYQDGLNLLEILKYSGELNLIQRDTLRNIDKSIFTFKGMSYLLYDDQMFIVYYNNTHLKLCKVNKDFSIMKDTIIKTNIGNPRLTIVKLNGDDFMMVQNDRGFQQFDFELNQVSEQFNLPSMMSYIGREKFLVVYEENYDGKRNGMIMNSKSDTIEKNITFCSYCTDINLKIVDKDNFVFGYYDRFYKKFFIVVYSSNGIKLTNPIQIVGFPQSSPIKLTKFNILVNEMNLFTTWSDNRNGNFDVFSNVFNIKKYITNIDYPGNTAEIMKFSLEQNYPNPFNPSTVIEYEIPTPPTPSPMGRAREGSVTLKIYDVLGREIETLVNEQKPSGRYSVQWNAGKYSSGIYFYELRAGNFREIKKMMFLK